jgi:cysteine desulfurase/selenocysteine lyase
MNHGTTENGSYDVARIREDFPILKRQVHGKNLVYLDNGATTQRPRIVVETLSRYYAEDNANIHRGVHYLSQKSTDLYEAVRGKVARFLNARSENEIVFTKGTTESINLVASAWGCANVKVGDEVLISAMEHHSNIVPWQMVCDEKGAHLRVIPMTDSGELRLEELPNLLSTKTKMVAVTQVSNVLGTITQLPEIIRAAHAVGALVLVDGAQGAPHLGADVQALDIDFYAFSAHKLYGPTGVGVLWGRENILNDMPPYQGGGDMILTVTFEKTQYKKAPGRFEAGTPNIGGVIGFGAALDYIASVGSTRIAAHETELLAYGTRVLSAIPGVRLIGTASHKAAVLSFVMEGAHPHDIGTILDKQGVAIRAGHHCAQPVMDRLGISATARASLGMYNTKEELDALCKAVWKVKEIFG